MEKRETTYWQTLRSGIRSSLKGLRLSMRHLRAAHQRHTPTNVQDPLYFDQATGMVTLRYPMEAIPVPDHGRYRLHNEMDDCIVCDKCAKICPVDCIEIEPIRATGEVGRASDGSPIRLYAARFDIDMAKCCYCGLCTTVCPTECLTMTKTYDFSEFDVRDFNYHFANISPVVAEEKRQLYEQFVAEKAAAKAGEGEKGEGKKEAEGDPKPVARPVFKPSFKKPAPELTAPAEEATAEALSAEPPSSDEKPKPRPVFKPTMRKAIPVEEKTEEPPLTPEPSEPAAEPMRPRPVFKPTMRKATPLEAPPVSAEVPPPADPAPEPDPAPPPKPRPVFKPTFKKPPTESTDPA